MTSRKYMLRLSYLIIKIDHVSIYIMNLGNNFYMERVDVTKEVKTVHRSFTGAESKHIFQCICIGMLRIFNSDTSSCLPFHVFCYGVNHFVVRAKLYEITSIPWMTCQRSMSYVSMFHFLNI